MTNVAKIIRDYEDWKRQQEFEADPLGPEAYEHSLFVEKELRTLIAVRHCVFLDNATNAFLCNLLAENNDGALAEVEASYEA